ncbi:MAG TPA: c-type cytochrome [Verrucomicrobiae bacterium]|nr:c-type cytochrome [Verrucomicrobiae bacterium]
MKRSSAPHYLFFLPLVFALALFTAAAQTKIKEIPAHQPDSNDGKFLYNEYCAVCHGTDGKGHGPAAGALKTGPGDLTQLTRRNNGKFPSVEVEHTISLGGRFLAHGSTDMPVWGHIFTDDGRQQGLGTIRVYALTQYLDQLQAR